MKYYRQCTLRSGNTFLTAWIEEKGAKIGHSITLKDSKDTKRFWQVLDVGDVRLPEAKTKLQEQAYKHQRKVSDI